MAAHFTLFDTCECGRFVEDILLQLPKAQPPMRDGPSSSQYGNTLGDSITHV